MIFKKWFFTAHVWHVSCDRCWPWETGVGNRFRFHVFPHLRPLMPPQHRRPLWHFDKLETGWAILYSCFVLLILDFQPQNYVYWNYLRRFVLLHNEAQVSVLFFSFPTCFFVKIGFIYNWHFSMRKLPASCSFMKSFYGLKTSTPTHPSRFGKPRPCQEQVCGYVSEQVLPHALNGEHICPSAFLLRLYCRMVEHDWFQATWFACETTMCFSNAFWPTTNPATCSEGKSSVMFEGCSERKTISTFLPDVI